MDTNDLAVKTARIEGIRLAAFLTDDLTDR